MGGMRLRFSTWTLLILGLLPLHSQADFYERFERLSRDFSFSETDPYLASVLSLRFPPPTLKFFPLVVGSEVKLSCALQDLPADLVFFFPGLGGSRFSASTQSLAQSIFESGKSVCLFSNSFHQEIYWLKAFAPGDQRAELEFYWSAMRSAVYQLRNQVLRVHGIAWSYGTHVLKRILSEKRREWEIFQAKSLRKQKIDLGSFIFLSPPQELLHSMSLLDQQWERFRPALAGQGTLGYLFLSMSLLSYLNDPSLEISSERDEDRLRAFILRGAFYSNLQGMKEFLYGDSSQEASLWEDDRGNFQSYLHNYLQPRLGEGELPRLSFGESWPLNRRSLVIYAADDFILDASDDQNLRELESVPNLSLLRLERGSHLGYLSHPEIRQLLAEFLNDEIYAR